MALQPKSNLGLYKLHPKILFCLQFRIPRSWFAAFLRAYYYLSKEMNEKKKMCIQMSLDFLIFFILNRKIISKMGSLNNNSQALQPIQGQGPQSTIDLTSTCQQTSEISSCQFRGEFCCRFWHLRSGLPLQTSSYPNFSGRWVGTSLPRNEPGTSACESVRHSSRQEQI